MSDDVTESALARRGKVAPVADAAQRRALAVDTLKRAETLVDETTPENTRRARFQAMRYFWSWAALGWGLPEHYPVEPWVAVKFLVDHLDGLAEGVDQVLVELGVKRKLGSLTLTTIELRLRHLAAAHRVRGLASPTVDPIFRESLRAAKRRRAQQGDLPRKMAPITASTLDQLVATCGKEETIDIRDEALLEMAWSGGGRRRSEVAAAKVEHLEPVEDDYLWTVPRSKTDQEGKGLVVAVRGKAALALRRWLSVSAITDGYLFRRVLKSGRVGGRPDKPMSGQTVLDIVRRRAAAAGLDPTIFGAHSLRSGFVTSGLRAGYTEHDLMAATGHKSRATFEGYAAPTKALKNPALDQRR